MKELDKILDSEEKVLWEGKPIFLPFVLRPLILSSFTFLIVLIIGLFQRDVVDAIIVGSIVFLAPIYTLLVYKFTYYALTTKRAVFQAGVIGRDFMFLDFDKITNAEVNVGIVDKVCGKNTGNILFYSAGTFVKTKHGIQARPYQFAHIKDPYALFKMFQKTSHDIKTDIEYPNALRPDQNPGYQTKYKKN
jgi:hypothetical protein